MPLLLLLGLVLPAVACAGLRIQAPSGYAEVQSHTFQQKLVSPGGTVIAVRHFANPDPRAGLAYWAEALEYQKTTREGMTLAARDAIATESGLDGVLFDFEVGERPGHILYLIALFVIDDSIYTIEVGGTPEAVADGRETILAAIKSFG